MDSDIGTVEEIIAVETLKSEPEKTSKMSHQIEPEITECKSNQDEWTNGEFNDEKQLRRKNPEALKCLNCGTYTGFGSCPYRRKVQEWMIVEMQRRGAEFDNRRKYVCNRCRLHLERSGGKRNKQESKSVPETENDQEKIVAQTIKNDHTEADNTDIKNDGELSTIIPQKGNRNRYPREDICCIMCSTSTDKKKSFYKNRKLVHNWMIVELQIMGAAFDVNRKWVCNPCLFQLKRVFKQRNGADVPRIEKYEKTVDPQILGNESIESNKAGSSHDRFSLLPSFSNTSQKESPNFSKEVNDKTKLENESAMFTKYSQSEVTEIKDNDKIDITDSVGSDGNQECIKSERNWDKKSPEEVNDDTQPDEQDMEILKCLHCDMYINHGAIQYCEKVQEWMIVEMRRRGAEFDSRRKYICTRCRHHLEKSAGKRNKQESESLSEAENDQEMIVAKTMKNDCPEADNAIVRSENDCMDMHTKHKQDNANEMSETIKEKFKNYIETINISTYELESSQEESGKSHKEMNVDKKQEKEIFTKTVSGRIQDDYNQDTTDSINSDDAQKCIKCDKNCNTRNKRNLIWLKPKLVTQSLIDYLREHRMTFTPTRRYLCYNCSLIIKLPELNAYKESYKHNATTTTKKEMKVLKFANPGKFMEDFNPETSARELRKVNRKIIKQTVKKNQMYDESGLLLNDSRDLCDCLDTACPGCHFPCSKCDSEKCGGECRCNRKYVYEKVEVEGSNLSWEFFL